MKIITILTGVFALAINTLIGVIVSAYPQFNLHLNNAIIVIHTLLILAVLMVNLKDAFRISLSFLFSTISLCMFICGFYVVPQFENNIFLIAMLVIVLFEIITLIVTNYITNKIK